MFEVQLYSPEDFSVDGNILNAGQESFDFSNNVEKIYGIRTMVRNLIMEGHEDIYYSILNQLV